MNRRREGDRDSRRYYDWLDRACSDLAAARLLLSEEDTLDAAAFHCQQCIEKALKGYILYRTRNHVDGHNLTWLCRQAIRQDSRFGEWLFESAILNRFYIETRYPSDIPLALTRDGVSKAFRMAESMYRFICGELEIPAAADAGRPHDGILSQNGVKQVPMAAADGF